MRRDRTAIAASFVLGFALLRTPSAHAADGDTERARALFEEAGELERHGQWGAAQERLRAALRLRETPQLYYALAWALENDDKLLEAKAEYEAAARLGRERAGGEEASRLAAARLADLDRKMPIIKVRVVGDAKASARVVVDGRELKREDDVATTPVNPGSHVIRVERGADGAVEQMVYVGRSTVRTVDVDAGEAVAPRDRPQDSHRRVASRPTAPARDAATSHDDGVLPWLLLSGGIAFVAGGGALLISADADADTRDSMRARWCAATACTGTTASQAETAEAAGYRLAASDAADTGKTKQAFGLALGGAGLVAGTVGAILLLRGEDRSEKTGPSTPARARATAAPLPGGGIASATFSF
ncbi:MAG TPA: hypothetical protein VM925_21290 [Labilithrix sp.]|nr:hypothetical protein [Labilithrix sp.]